MKTVLTIITNLSGADVLILFVELSVMLRLKSSLTMKAHL